LARTSKDLTVKECKIYLLVNKVNIFFSNLQNSTLITAAAIITAAGTIAAPATLRRRF